MKIGNLSEHTHEINALTNKYAIIEMMRTKVLIATVFFILIGAAALLYSRSPQPEKSVSPTDQRLQPTVTVQNTKQPKVFKIEGVPYSFSLTEIRVLKGDVVKIEFTTKQGIHDWVLDEFNVRTPQLSQGQSNTVEFVADKTGTFEYYCSIGNHRQMGMVGKLIVE